MKTAYKHVLTATFLSLLVACGGGGGGDTTGSGGTTGGGTTISSDPAANVVTTFASGFSRPKGVAVDSNGNVYVSDSVNHTI
ncbi:SBBP repeat-containing protein, partial [Limnohabitans sp.]|uniref:SBBP repeat-containing protein n=1 Tax=Limnohabitans sp. TaxID=1907725 RepID=UPI0037BED8E1